MAVNSRRNEGPSADISPQKSRHFTKKHVSRIFNTIFGEMYNFEFGEMSTPPIFAHTL